MRARHSGCIVYISSVGGFVSWAGWGIYCATKFAVEGLSEAMRTELQPLGIRVIIVEPGAFRTDFLDSTSLERAERTFEDYTSTVGATRSWSDQTNHAQRGDPVKAAAVIVAAASTTMPPLRVPLGQDCIERMERKLEEVTREVTLGRAIALSTDYEPEERVERSKDAGEHVG
jgi:NAD(P)-dependent dehydrogenase (short-subunit alcohol dehydrogenase family)